MEQFILLQRSRREHYNLISLQGRSARVQSTIHIIIFFRVTDPVEIQQDPNIEVFHVVRRLHRTGGFSLEFQQLLEYFRL